MSCVGTESSKSAARPVWDTPVVNVANVDFRPRPVLAVAFLSSAASMVSVKPRVKVGDRSGGESDGNEVRSVVALEEAECRFWGMARAALVLWLLLDTDDACEDERR